MSLNKFTLKAFDGKSPQHNFGGNDYNTYNEKGGTLKLPSPRRDFGYDQRSDAASGTDSYYPAIRNAGGLYKRIAAETPQSEMNSYLNWVPQKEKLNLASIQKNHMSPMKASLNNYFDDGRDGLSRTALKARDKFNYSQLDKNKAGKDSISIDGFSMNGYQPKPRAISNLRTYDNGNQYSAQKIELNSIYKPKNALHMTPGPKRGLLDELPWSEQQKIMGYSMAKINTLKRDDILKAINLPDATSNYNKANLFRRGASIGGGDNSSPIEDALKRIAKAGEDFGTMKDYARALIKRFDSDNDGVITFQELCEGLKQFDIDLPLNQRIGLMKKLDVDRDGEITDVELTRALKTVEDEMIHDAVETAIKKIASGAEEFTSMREYVKVLFKKFDLNNDGLITLQELSDGLKRIQIYLSSREKQALMGRLDLNRDGEISSEELLKILQSTDTKLTKSQLNTSVDHVVQRLLEGSSKFGSMKEYAKHLIRKFDNNSDGIINFQELCEGLSRMNIIITNQEKAGLMKKLDIDRDGQITEKEMLFVLAGSQNNNRSPRISNNSGLVEKVLMKIANGADDVNNMRQYSQMLIRKFDRDNDGFISINELTSGLRTMGIFLTPEERDALMSKFDTNKDGNISDAEIYNVLSTINTKDLASQARESADIALKKLAAGAEDHPNMREYVRFLIKKFDFDNDGIITFNELCDGIRALNIFLTLKERQALMKSLDLNNDGRLSADELFTVLSKVDVKFTKAQVKDQVDNALKKIASGAEDFSSMKEYVHDLMNKFDSNYDGFISFEELTNGLRSIKINLTSQEKQALMKRLDFNRDGEIAEEEIFRAIAPYGAQKSYSTNNRSPRISNNSGLVEKVLMKIANGADDVNNMRQYSQMLIRKFDRDNDGFISINELTSGLRTMGIFLTPEERDALMSKFDTNKDGNISDAEIYNVLSTINTKDLASQARESADIALKKLAAGAEDHPNMREYVRFLIKKFDFDNDGIITFNELCDGIRALNIFLTLKERQALMKSLDLNNDGRLSADELFTVLSKVDVKFTKAQVKDQVDNALKKIASGAEDFSSMKEYVHDLMNKFDSNYDGFISFEELTNGLRSIKINLTSQEKQALMKRLDFNRDGEIAEEEIFRAIAPYGAQKSYSTNNRSPVRGSPVIIAPNKVSLAQKEKERISVDDIIAKIKKSTTKYQSLKHFVSAMMRRYDTDGDGYLNFQELSDGLAHDNIKLTKDERLALMKHLDVDCDGAVSRDEIFNALVVDARHQRSHHFSKVNVDHLLKRIKQGAEKFRSLEEFCHYIFKKMDIDKSGTLSFNELSAGLTDMGIEISQKEKHELMKKLDDDADGEIAFDEFYKGLSNVSKFSQPDQMNASDYVNIDHALIKIARGAEQYKCIEDYIILLFRKFDINKDGALSFKELRDGLMSLNVHLADNEMHALFHKLDTDRDGDITQEELYNAILSKEKYTKNPNIGQQKVNVDHVLALIKKGVEKYSSLGEYVKALMKKFDQDGDGSISIDELSQGLKSINVKISDKEKLALMKELDKDRDGGIAEHELYNALAQGSEVGDYNSAPKRTLGRPSPGVEQLMAKIRRAVSHYKSQQEQIIGLMRIFDLDNDGMISFIELVDGIKQLGIQAKKTDVIELMNRMDVDKDGWISQKELYSGLGLQAAHNEYQGTTVQVDQVLTKLKKGADKYHNLGEYINVLFQMFATAGANFMTFQELNNCLKTFNFNLTQVEKLALMKKMDENGDNEISKEEFYNALAQAGRDTVITRTIGGAVSPSRTSQYADPDEQRVDQALLKIKSGAAKYRSLGDYCMHLMRKLDTNKDGFITYLELVEGLRDMGIKIYKGEQAALMRRLDDDKDGVICYDELYRALNMVR